MEIVSFKRGADLHATAPVGTSDALMCDVCGVRTELGAAEDLGWQESPPVCPDCLRWGIVAGSEIRAPAEALQIARRGRFWAVHEGGVLLCLTVYRKGARAVVQRIARGAGGDGGR